MHRHFPDALQLVHTLGTGRGQPGYHRGWTAVTKDRRLSAHFEFAVAVTPYGPWILSEPYPYGEYEAEVANA